MPDSSDAPLVRHAAAPVQGRYVVRPPRGAGPAHQLIGFHGYAQTADGMFDAFCRSAPDDDWLVVSVQALHVFYAGRTQNVVASWMTRLDREHAIASNVAYVDAVIAALDREFGAPRMRAFAGFSQGVGMAHRAAVLCAARCDAVVTVGGDVPPELAAAPPRRWPRVLAMTGERDEWYAPAALERDAAGLRPHAPDVRTHVFAAGHEWSDEVCSASAAFLREVSAATAG